MKEQYYVQFTGAKPELFEAKQIKSCVVQDDKADVVLTDGRKGIIAKSKGVTLVKELEKK